MPSTCWSSDGEECAWPSWYGHFASQQCEGRVQWDWEQINMPNRQPDWWEASYRQEDIEHMTTETGLGIHKAINAVKRTLASGGGIAKGGKAMGYAFRGIEDIDAILCGLTAEHGIVVYPRVRERETIHGLTKNGGYNAHVFLLVDWIFVHEDGSSFTTSTVGEAMDTQDKAVNKAMQASRKYAYVLTFMIPVAGDDIEIYVPDPTVAAGRADRPHGTDTPIAAVHQEATQAAAQPVEQAKRTRGPNKPKDVAPLPVGNLLPAEITHPAEVLNGTHSDLPFTRATQLVQQSPATSIVARVNTTNTFDILYKFAQEAESTIGQDSPDRAFVFGAIKSRAIALFGAADSMKGVTEGFELVSALGQPDDLKQAANAAYGRFRK